LVVVTAAVAALVTDTTREVTRQHLVELYGS
jgi:hypothetical protein